MAQYHAVEAASKYSYDSVADQWHRETVWVRIDDEPFAMVMMLRAVVGDNALSPCVRGSLTQCMWTPTGQIASLPPDEAGTACFARTTLCQAVHGKGGAGGLL